MKVRCVRLLNSDGNPVEKNTNVELERVYHVLSIDADLDGLISYRITEREGEYRPCYVFLRQAICFEVVSTRIPSLWKPYISERGGLFLRPPAWSEAGFLERYYDDDPEAEKIFVRDAQMIVAEDP